MADLERRADDAGNLLKVCFPDDLFIRKEFRGKEILVTKTYHPGLGKNLYAVGGLQLNGFEREYVHNYSMRIERRKKKS